MRRIVEQPRLQLVTLLRGLTVFVVELRNVPCPAENSSDFGRSSNYKPDETTGNLPPIKDWGDKCRGRHLDTNH